MDRVEASGNRGPTARLEEPEVPKMAVGAYWQIGDKSNGTKLAGEAQQSGNAGYVICTSGVVGGRQG